MLITTRGAVHVARFQLMTLVGGSERIAEGICALVILGLPRPPQRRNHPGGQGSFPPKTSGPFASFAPPMSRQVDRNGPVGLIEPGRVSRCLNARSRSVGNHDTPLWSLEIWRALMHLRSFS